MGIADRLRDAARPSNSIEAVEASSRSPAEGLHGASPAAPAMQSTDRPAPGLKKPAYASEPDSVSKAYYIEDRGGERQYFDDYKRKGLAMRATETSITSKREDVNTVKAMLDVAAARGWVSVEVKGTTEFKREAWIEAQARGIEARGYRATDPDQQEADRRRAERGPVNEVRLTAVAALPASAATRPDASAVAEQAKTPVAPVLVAASRETKIDPDKAKGSKEAPGKETVDARAEPGKATLVDNRRALRDATGELSSDGRLVLSAMADKIDRQMNRHNIEAKTEMKAYVATELVKKERAEGPVVLSAEQKRTAAAPEPARTEAVRPVPAAEPVRRNEPEAPRRTLSR